MIWVWAATVVPMDALMFYFLCAPCVRVKGLSAH